MAGLFNNDFIEYIELLNKYQVEYFLLGGIAVNVYGYRRSTGDMDIFVKPTKVNHLRIQKVHHDFGMHMGEMELLDNFLNTDKFDVYTFGVSPIQIDVMTRCAGLVFDDVFSRTKFYEITPEVEIRVIHINDLLEAKKASGRPRDLADIHELKKLLGYDRD